MSAVGRAARGGLALVVAVAATVAGVALLAAGFFLLTPFGARLGVRTAAAIIEPAELAVGAIDGTLATRLVLRDLRYSADGLAAAVERIEIDPAWQALADGRIVLERLVVDGARVTVTAGADPAPPEPAAGSAPPALPEIPAQVAIREIDVTDVAVAGIGDTPIRVERIAGSVDGPDVALDTVALNAAGVALTASARATLAGDASGTVDARVTLPGDGDAAQRLTLVADFALDTTADPWAATVRWSELALIEGETTVAASPSGAVTIWPGATPMRLSLDATATADALPDAVALDAQGTLAGDRLGLEQLTVETLGGTIRASGTLQTGLDDGRLTLDFDSLDPAFVDDRLSGRLEGELDVELTGPAATAFAAEGRVGGMLGGRALDGRFAVSLRDETLSIRRAELALGDDAGRISVDGTLGPRSADLSLSARLPAIDAWYPPAAGAVEATGRISGSPEDPSVELDVDARDLALDDSGLPAIDELAVDVSGRLASHRISASALTEAGRAAVAVDQGFAGDGVAGSLLALELEPPRGGEWSLAEPARYAATPDEVTLDRACLTAPAGGRLCASVAGNTLDVEIRALDASLLDPWLPAEAALVGTVDGRADVNWTPPVDGSFALTAETLRLADPAGGDGGAPPPDADADLADELTALAEITNLDVRGELTGERFSAELGAQLAATGDRIEGSIAVAPPAADGNLTATLEARLTDLELVDALSDDVENLEGSAAVALTAGGTLEAPELDGRLALDVRHAGVPELGIELTDSALAVEAADGAVAVGAEVCSGGCVEARGSLVTDAPDAAWRATGEVAGEGFRLAALDDMQLTVTPDIDFTVTPALVRLTGDVAVPQARVVVDDVPVSAVRPAPETVVHGRAPAETDAADTGAAALPLELDVDATLGDVRFEGLGIAAELDGALEIDQSVGGPLTVQGTATVDEGTFTAYGQTLTIDGGRLIFTGAPDNPSLDIRATREVEGGIVGLTITGTARNPRSEIFSDPPLSESEALARLVTGRSLESSGEADADSLERAAIGLGIRRALPALDRIGQGLGLDELGVDAPGDTEGALIAGKQLGDDVYLRYKHGLFDDFAGLELVYRITERFRLRTETGTAQSIDLIYDVDRDRDEPAALEEQVGEGIAADGRAPGDVAAPAAPE